MLKCGVSIFIIILFDESNYIFIRKDNFIIWDMVYHTVLMDICFVSFIIKCNFFID
jgi:hypothetical protein